MHLVRATLERYVPVSDDAWAVIRPCWQADAFRKGEMITAPGNIEDHFGIVESGVQRLYFEHDGNAHCLGFSYDGSWSGVYDSFVTRTPSRFGMQAVTDSVIWRITYPALQDLYGSIPGMERFGRLIMEELLIGRATREIEIMSLSAEQRYQRLMARSPQLLQLVAQKDIASYLGMTPETFSRLRAKVR